MTVEEAVVARILTIVDVTPIIGTRVWMLKLPQKPTLPAVRVQVIDDIEDYHLRGGITARRARVQIDAYAAEASGVDPYAQAVELADAIHGDSAESGLSGWQGEVGSPPLDVTGVFRIDRGVLYEGGELRLVRVRQDYEVHYERAI